jgi:hypothetical protein
VDDDKPQKGLPPVSVRIVAMGELTLHLISSDELNALERGSPTKAMATLANSLLSVAGSLVGSLLLSGPPPVGYRFTIFAILVFGCLVIGLVLLILSQRFKKDDSEVIKRIRSRAGGPTGPQIAAQSPVVEIVDEADEESH